MTDTEAGTPLTAEEERKLRGNVEALGPHVALRERDVSRLLATLDAARSRPATDPAGLDVERLGTAMSEAWPADEQLVDDSEVWHRFAPLVAAEYARLSVADGPGPEERHRPTTFSLAWRAYATSPGGCSGDGLGEPSFCQIHRAPWRRGCPCDQVLADRLLAALSRPLPENREEPSR